MTTQLIYPNPNIACVPGMCLQYVRQTFDLPIRYGSATQAWINSPAQHQDRDFPAGCWVPVWFAIDIEPNGHVALLAPDGTVYSSSDNGNVPHHHPGIDDLISYYAYWGKMQLTYLGWSEDVAGYPVVSNDSSISFDSVTTPTQEDPLANLTPEVFAQIKQAALEGALAALDYQVPDAGDKTMTSVLDVARILRPLVHAVPAETLKRDVVRSPGGGGGTTSLAGIVAYFDESRLATIKAMPGSVAAPAAVDVEALVTRLKTELPPAVFAEFKAQINK